MTEICHICLPNLGAAENLLIRETNSSLLHEA
jgi:hypothetical protein